MNHTQRFLAINGRLLKAHRLEQGMTQLQLAKSAGYSERLIRKAENGGTLDIATIQDLAEALCQTDKVVPWESLVLDNLAIAKSWMEALDTYGRDMLPCVEPCIANDFVFYCPGNLDVASFIGTFHGPTGFQKWLDSYFSEFTREPGSELQYFVGEDSVIARWLELANVQGIPCGPIRISTHFRFQEGQLVRIEFDHDTKLVADAIMTAHRSQSEAASSFQHVDAQTSCSTGQP